MAAGRSGGFRSAARAKGASMTAPSARVGWPAAGLSWIPAPSGVEILATAVRDAAYGAHDLFRPLIDLEPICAVARASVSVARLAGEAGSTEAQISPADDDSFVICVDP